MVAYVPPKQAGKYKAVASGAITNGKPVIVNADGTVGTTTTQTTVTQSVGSQVTFENALTAFTSTVFDSNAGKIVIAYEDDDNSDYGTAIVGTVSGTSISFGSAAIFESAAVAYVAAAFDSNSNKVVISYVDQGNSYYGTAIVGTVSGTSISFGTPVVYESGGTVAHNNITFDSTNNKVVIAYRDDGNSFYGTAIVGTVSGTGISFGTAAVFESAESGEITLDFDSSNGKVVIAYTDGGDGNKPKAVVGTVSGTGISFGTAVGIDTGDAGNLTMAFDSNSNRIVISYKDGNNSNYGTAIVGTVSGTTISFGTAVAYNSGTNGQTTITFDSNVNKVAIMHRDQSDSSDGKLIVGTVDPSDNSISFGSSTTFNSGYTRMYPSASAFDSTNNKVVVAYRDTGESNIGNAIVFQIGGTTTSNALTSENYIGIASGGTYADTAEATIDVVGTVNKDQSGLTAGQTYYVQNDGTLGTTADDPSVVAGTAISATELIVKG